jgi:hypothetical protein
MVLTPLQRAWSLLASLPIGIVLFETALGVTPGPLQNTGTPGQGALVLKLPQSFSPPRHGSVVVYRSPLDPSASAVGEITGIPGDARPHDSRSWQHPGRLLSGQVWVQCSEAGAGQDCLDSRTFGPLPVPLVTGVPLFFFPSPFR